MKINLITCCYNEEKIIPYFLKNYDFCDNIVVFDNASTDNSLNLLSANTKVQIRSQDEFGGNGKYSEKVIDNIMSNAYFDYFDDEYDWQIVCAMDELLYPENILEKLKRYKKEGVSLPRIRGVEFFSEKEIDSNVETLHEQIQPCRYFKRSQKQAIFNPQMININFSPGTHYCSPEGEIVYSDMGDVLYLFHYRALGYTHHFNKYKNRHERLYLHFDGETKEMYLERIRKLTSDIFSNIKDVSDKNIPFVKLNWDLEFILIEENDNEVDLLNFLNKDHEPCAYFAVRESIDIEGGKTFQFGYYSQSCKDWVSHFSDSVVLKQGNRYRIEFRANEHTLITIYENDKVILEWEIDPVKRYDGHEKVFIGDINNPSQNFSIKEVCFKEIKGQDI